MLAHKLESQSIGGWYMSEKLDGQRAYWDGGITRGMPKPEVPWANTAKDGRLLAPQIATGLWSRYGNVIHASTEFLDRLPNFPLDGELYTGNRQQLRSIISKLVPGPEWKNVEYVVFDSPTLPEDGSISCTNFKKVIRGCSPFYQLHNVVVLPLRSFQSTYNWLQDQTGFTLHPQERLSMNTDDAENRLASYLDEVVRRGGEGVMLRHPGSYWMPERTHNLLKVKKLDDMEGTVVGYTSGRLTTLGSKLLGKMGALILDIGGKRLELSGFTDSERELTDSTWAAAYPGCVLPDDVSAKHFPRGSKVTFKYRGLSNAGIPTEARYWRKYDAV